MIKTKKLSQLVKRIKVGFVGSINEFYTEKELGIPIVSTTNITDSWINFSGIKYITHEFHTKNKKSQLKKGDLVVARHGDNGKVNVFENDFECQVLNAAIIEPNEDLLDPYSIKYILESAFVKKQIKGCVKGSVQWVINTSHISNLVIPFIEWFNYKNLYSILNDLEKKIELNNKINIELDAMAKTLYDYWFVQFDFPDMSGKPYKSSGGKMVWNNELKKLIPEGWNSEKLWNEIKISRWISYSTSDLTGNEWTPMINLNSFYLDWRYKHEWLKYIKWKFNSDKLIQSWDLLIATTDVTRNAYIIWKSFILPDIFKTEVILSCDIAKVEISGSLNNHYLDMVFNSDYYHRYIRWFASGTIVLHLDTNWIDWFNILIPPPYLLEQFSLLKAKNELRKSYTIKENLKLWELRDWLLPMLMNGQVTIK